MKMETIKFPKEDLIPSKSSLVDEYKTYHIKGNDEYLLKVLKEQKPIENLKKLVNLLDELYYQKLVPETKPIIAEIEGAKYFAFLQRKINPVTYPFEWTPSMVKDVALKVINVNMVANEHGFTLKDAHPYNLTFYQNVPLWLDIGSFKEINSSKKQCFMAISEFYSHIYLPLLLASKGLLFLSKKIYSSIERNPFNELFYYDTRILTKIIPRSIINKIVNFFFKYQAICCKSEAEVIEKLKYLKKGSVFILFYKTLKQMGFPFVITNELLEKKIRKIRISYNKTQWAKYYDEKIPRRFSIIAQLIKEFNIKHIVDIGGNTGLFGRYLFDNGIIDKYICIDIDIEAIDIGFKMSKKGGYKNIIFINSNPFVPNIPALFQPLEERAKSECVTALALTHHLILSQNFDLDYCLETLYKFTTKYAFIEFMPMGLYDGKNPPPPVPSYYNLNWFKEHFCKYFELVLWKEIDINRILFVGIKRE